MVPPAATERHADNVGLSRRVVAIATGNGGYVTRDQLRMIGMSDSAIDRSIRRGDMHAVSTGVFQVLPSNDHADLMRGAQLALPGGVASHQSAAHLLRLPELPALVPTLTVVSTTTHRFPGVTVRRTDDLSSHHVVNIDGIQCTNGGRTLFDLAGVLRYRQFASIAETAITAGRVRLDQLEIVANELCRRGKRGTKAIGDFLEWNSSGSGTALERRGRAILKGSSLPSPIPEYSIPWRPHQRFDDAYPTHTFAIEWDSRRWHERRAAMQSDRERDREAAMHGWVVVRFTWDDVTESPSKVALTVARILADRQPSART